MTSSASTHANNPTPLNVDRAEYFDNPVVASLSPKVLNNMADGYNLNFEPYATRFDNKLVVDDEAGEIIGVRKQSRSKIEEKALEKSNLDLKFEFQGPKRTSDERHYFKTIQENYAAKVRSRRNSLSDLDD